ncbi:MAG: serine/threonine protein kinase, partial [Chloroflexi bacterium]|nr:serine/threonine protein kinase [Chloroflexota bacterium]
MTSDRIKRRIEALLDEADQAVAQSQWDVARDRAQNVLAFDPDNADAKAYLAAAERALSSSPSPTRGEGRGGGQATARAGVSPSHVGAQGLAPLPSPQPPTPAYPAAFAGGRYQVKRFLGEGGKKRVYLAHDTNLDRDVAFALIKTGALDLVARSRITREAQAMARLGEHPHIMPIYELGEDEDRPYMVLPLMGGGDVEGAIEKAADRRMPLERALQIAIETCRGLEFAHGLGIVHRDLKPGNVWLTADGVAKIGDFGLAVALDRSRLTAEGMMVGTVAYMPPEQATGGEVTSRSDLYSLGAMVYEMVTGRPPFVGDSPVAIIGQHLNTPPVAPTWHRPDCPAVLEALLLRLLEKDATKRPGSAKEVREILEGIARASASVGAQGLAPLPGDSPFPQREGGQGVRSVGTGAGPNPIYRRVFVGRE